MHLGHRISLANYGAPSFYLDELMHPDLYKVLPRNGLYMVENMPQTVVVLQAFRDLLGKPVFINTWARGGKFVNSGLRLPDGPYARLSAHKYFLAFDCKSSGVSGPEMVDLILSDREVANHFYSLGLREIENPKYTKTWAHLGFRDWGGGRIKIINP